VSLPDNPTPSSVPAVDPTVVLSDGRALGYALWGEPEGSPVLLVGTSPGSRLLCPDLAATLAAGVRLVTVDRPGAGRSDPDPHPSMARWVADAGALVDHLRLGRVGLVGWSGGGQFALAAAAGLPDRVTAVALAGTPAPAHDDLGDWPPEEIRQLVGLVRKDPQGAVAGVAAANQWYPADPQSPMRLWSAPGDQAVGNLPRVAEAMAVMLREGARQGVAGLVYDIVAGSLDWGFPLGEVRTSVALWYGPWTRWSPPSTAATTPSGCPMPQRSTRGRPTTCWPFPCGGTPWAPSGCPRDADGAGTTATAGQPPQRHRYRPVRRDPAPRASAVASRASLTIAALAVAAGSNALMQTLVVPAIGVLAQDLGASPRAATWVLTAFLLASAVLAPPLSSLGDGYGKRRLLLVVVLWVYLVGTLGAMAAPNLGALVGFRAVQGTSLAVLPLRFGILREAVPAD
jgi:pimeloyl-ACP methyl ester carboxylesterase